MRRSAALLLCVFALACAGVSCYSAPIHDAAAKDRLWSVQRLLRGTPSLLNIPDDDGATPLHHAVAGGSRRIVSYLVGRKADANARKRDGVTPLHVAAALGFRDIATILVNAGADVNARDGLGRTALVFAQGRGQRAVAEYLKPLCTASDGSTLPGSAVAPVVDPSHAACTALRSQDSKLYVGLADGSVAIYSPQRRSGVTVKPCAEATRTLAVTAGGGSVWWLTAHPQTLFEYREKDGTVTAHSLGSSSLQDSSEGNARYQRLEYWDQRVAVLGPTDACFYDPRTGAVSSVEDSIGDMQGGSLKGASIYLAQNGDRSYLAAAWRSGLRTRLTALRKDGSRWVENASCTGDGFGVAACLTAASLVMVKADAVQAIGISDRARKEIPLPVYRGSNLPSWEVQASACGDDVWWMRGQIPMHADLKAGTADAFMPWNEKDLEPRFLAADSGGAWVATNRGVRRISLCGPKGDCGYGGFVRVPICETASVPSSDVEHRLAGLVEEWRGTRYVWGGSTRSGTDCSGYVMAVHNSLGVNLPHGSAALRTLKAGLVVKDELCYGDVLVYPGHCAIYLGNGKTSETVPVHGVGNNNIWFRRDVTVRRFLPGPRNSLTADSRVAHRSSGADIVAAYIGASDDSPLVQTASALSNTESTKVRISNTVGSRKPSIFDIEPLPPMPTSDDEPAEVVQEAPDFTGWVKGNLHTHTQEGDGKEPVDKVISWYRDHGYGFIVLDNYDRIVEQTKLDPGKLVVVPGGSSMGTFGRLNTPIDVSALGIPNSVQLQKSETITKIMQGAVDGVIRCGGAPMLLHPKLTASQLGISTESLSEALGLSGRSYVLEMNESGVEPMWDALLSAGQSVYAAVTDDAQDLSEAGRRFVSVRADQTSSDAIVEALNRGDFYTSTGVELQELEFAKRMLRVVVRQKGNSKYKIQFIGENGRLLLEVDASEAVFSVPDDPEFGYVRAKIISDYGAAWTQAFRG